MVLADAVSCAAMKLRVGLVGLGEAWNYRHRPALLALHDRFEVRAVCEQVARRAQQAADVFGAVAVDGYRELASRPDVDAILMLSTQWYGALPILAACDAGKAVYCADTLDLDAEQANSIRTRVEASGVAFMAEFPRRHSPATLRLKELIATQLGPVDLLFCHQRLTVKEKQGSPAALASPISRELIELVDWCRYVVGREPISVTGVGHPQARSPLGEDYRMLSLAFPGATPQSSATVAQISCGHYMPDVWKEAVSFRTPAGLQVCCERGIAFVDLPSSLVWFDEVGRHHEALEREMPVGEQLLSQFHRAVTSLVRRRDDLDDAYRALTIITAARESHASGQRIDLDFER